VAPVSRHADAMDADAYWRAYEVKIAWEKPMEVIGTVEALKETRAKPGDPWTPRLAIRQDDGILVIVDAYQQRLLAELVLARPAVGDRIRIRYHGEDKRSAPGMNPVKRFSVQVRREGSQTPERADGTSGETASENAPESET
jgi:hypothetical protein